MALKSSVFKDSGGGVLLMTALMTPLLLIIVGVTIDLGKMYAVRAKAQNALDTAILGAANTSNSRAIRNEARRIFRANFPSRYMDARDNAFRASQSGNNFTATVRIRVPWSIMQIFGFRQANFVLTSVVSKSDVGAQMELSIVIDNSQGVNVTAIANSTKSFISVLYDNEAVDANTNVSIVPFSASVNVGIPNFARLGWAQNAFAFLIYGGFTGNGYLANRNPDIPPNNFFNDLTDDPPSTALSTRFRTPYGNAPGFYNNGDWNDRTLERVLFSSVFRADIHSTLDDMRAGGSTRTNVGLMWGWYTLSPKWMGRWDAALPWLPFPVLPTLHKNLLLIVGSRNNVYTGGNQVCGPSICSVSNDDITTSYMCQIIKSQGIKLYTIGFGNSSAYNESLLQSCSSGSGYFYTATQAELDEVYGRVLDHMKYSSLRLSQ